MDKQFLNYRVKIFTKDKTFLEGTLIMVDNECNAMIDDCEEFKDTKTPLQSPRQYLGLVVIPGKNIKYTEYLYKVPKINKFNHLN
ncbi:hypothetical protein AAJ76_20001133 [Vairimorpha ceranae]|uniref:Sm domain-containing protein n=1 Tax=Vairimorpha ceranae TaxID=40302 RepID=A0A0F9ZGV4_9MICR|nr:hypothetical protein AAJ76_20001133 [Vairimorpha ceranae]KKO76489.1 hypothetical protein AAJ76_20001133 [Vairimorpha ceranae]